MLNKTSIGTVILSLLLLASFAMVQQARDELVRKNWSGYKHQLEGQRREFRNSDLEVERNNFSYSSSER